VNEATGVFEVRAESDFRFLAPEYAQLFARSEATAFQHPLWLDRLYTRLAPEVGAEPVVITIRDGPRLAAVIPLLRRRYGLLRVIEFADLQVTDYVAPVCERADFNAIRHDPAVRSAIRKALQPFDLIRIQKLRDDSLPLAHLLAPASQSLMSMSAYSAELEAPFVSWRDTHLNSTLRKELDKKRRRLERKGEVRFAQLTDPADIERAFERMRDYRRARFEGRGDGNDLLQDPPAFAFYLDLANAGIGAGLTRTYAISLGGTPVAIGFGLVHRGAFLLVLTGSDFVAYKNLSLGLLGMEDMIADCIERGDVLFDLTIGDEDYKRQLGTKVTTLTALVASGSCLGFLAGRTLERPWAKRLAKRLVEKGSRRGSGATGGL
jgi:CelD/BcsL family acetyltransferase involved in cellulose biosynthesis